MYEFQLRRVEELVLQLERGKHSIEEYTAMITTGADTGTIGDSIGYVSASIQQTGLPTQKTLEAAVELASGIPLQKLSSDEQLLLCRYRSRLADLEQHYKDI